MDVNEQIVIAWLEECQGMFTRNNLDYGQFHSDIDILAVNLQKKEAWDCEIKVRTGSTQISDNSNKHNGFSHFIKTFHDEERAIIIRQFIPSNYPIKRKFITTKSLFGKTQETQSKWLKRFQEENVDVIFLDEIISGLNSLSLKLKKSTNSIIQTLRLLNMYKNQ